MARAKTPLPGTNERIFIDLGKAAPPKQKDGGRIKVMCPKDPVEIRLVKKYIQSKIIALIDLTSYTGDREVAFAMVRDLVNECGGDLWQINDSTMMATPFGVAVDKSR